MRDLLKIMTCGSVDDGKSTLIGHLMYDAKVLFADQESTLAAESEKIYGEKIDYSLLLDGLEAEREQRITIDVAYRFFSTKKRSFIIADTPGHNEYTRNMAVGASFADLAILLVDSTKGILPQTRRHFRICSIMGITDFVFAVNKADKIGYDKTVFDSIAADINDLTSGARITSCLVIPVSATEGDNLTEKSEATAWYNGVPLLDHLENIDIARKNEKGFILPVQRVSRIGEERGFQGSAESGGISVGDEIKVLPSGENSRIKRIYISDREAVTASAGDQITIMLEDDIDVSRGCVICSGADPSVSTRFKATVLWLDDEPLSIGKSYYIKLGTAKTPCSVVSVESALDVTGGGQYEPESISKNDIFVCTLSSSSPIVIDRFDSHKSLGAFILIDRVTHATAACGTVTAPLDDNYIYPEDTDVTPEARAASLGQRPVVLWFTGLPGSGKTTTANEVEKRLHALGKHTMLLDGDNLRSGINKNLGFTKEGRAENIRVTAEIAKLMADAGLIVLVSLVSPFREDRENAKRIIGDRFVEIYVSASADVCAARDKKGYYRKAKEGKIRNFTGVDGSYEPPLAPGITVDTERLSPAGCAEKVLRLLL
ncbi:MAG: adenylyl-sulfate kinase [Clostridia bacterium]|nr:adenylyl-sulfate kinase [Clostridia bacterium]